MCDKAEPAHTPPPRIIALLAPALGGYEAPGIYCFGCDGGCESDAGWERSQIAERGNGPHAVWDLALDGNDRAHVAFNAEPDVTGTANNRMYYLSCASDCAHYQWHSGISLAIELIPLLFCTMLR